MASLPLVSDPPIAGSQIPTPTSLKPLWLALGMLGTIDFLWLVCTPLRFSQESWQMLISLLPFVLIGGLGSYRFFDMPRLQMFFQGSAFILLSWPVLRVYNHLTMSTGLPLADQWLADIDAFLRLDWLEYALWLDKHPLLIRLMDLSYAGLMPYSIVLFLFLLFGRNPVERCQEMIVLFFSTALICSTIGMLFPAMGAAFQHNPSHALFANINPEMGAYHLTQFLGLRENPEHILALNDLPGLVTFPSFHTAMGVIAIYCARGTPWLLVPSLMFNILMISSTPLFGSHYFVDIIAGIGVSAAVIMLLRRYMVKPAGHAPLEAPAYKGQLVPT